MVFSCVWISEERRGKSSDDENGALKRIVEGCLAVGGESGIACDSHWEMAQDSEYSVLVASLTTQLCREGARFGGKGAKARTCRYFNPTRLAQHLHAKLVGVPCHTLRPSICFRERPSDPFLINILRIVPIRSCLICPTCYPALPYVFLLPFVTQTLLEGVKLHLQSSTSHLSQLSTNLQSPRCVEFYSSK